MWLLEADWLYRREHKIDAGVSRPFPPPARWKSGVKVWFTRLVICLSVCVSLSTLETTLIYSTKNGHQWAANRILFIILKKTEILQIGSIDSESILAVPCSSLIFGHAYQSSKLISKVKLSSDKQSQRKNVSLHKNTAVKMLFVECCE